jgi:hypothetical protein
MAGERKVAFTEDAARRVAAATLAYERGNRDMAPIKFRSPGGDDDFFRLGRININWQKGQTAVVELLAPDGSTLTTNENFEAVNYFATVNAVATPKKVGCALYGDKWILVAAEC